MKKWFFALPVLAVFVSAAKFEVIGFSSYSDKQYKISYRMRNGMFDGDYVSYYPGGQKKAEGKFSCNNRVGEWKAWDEKGKMVFEREYKNNFEYRQILPKIKTESKGHDWTLLNKAASGYYEYPSFRQEDVGISKRVWRYIPRNDSIPFFAKNIFWNALLDSVLQGKITAYSPAGDECITKLQPENLEPDSDTAAYDVIGFRIKEDWFYKKSIDFGQTQIIAICPVIRKKSNPADSSDVCWFKFQDVRNTLAGIIFDGSSYPLFVRSADDIFFFHCFHSDIYRESNIYNRSLSDYASGVELQNEQTRIEMELKEMEHGQWAKK